MRNPHIFFRAILASIFLAEGLGGIRSFAQPAAQFKQFDNSIVPLPLAAAANVVGFAADQRKLPLLFSLKMNNKADLEKRALGEPVSAAEMASSFGGDPAAVKNLTTWLAENGFTDIQVGVDGTRVSATATAQQIEKSLGAKMTNIFYQGAVYPTAATAPKLPSAIGDSVTAIGGLQPWIKATKHSVPRDRAVVLPAEQDAHLKPRPATSTAKTMKVREIMRAYDAENMGVTGKGQVIAILIDSLPRIEDLKRFWNDNGLKVAQEQVKFINVHGVGHA